MVAPTSTIIEPSSPLAGPKKNLGSSDGFADVLATIQGGHPEPAGREESSSANTRMEAFPPVSEKTADRETSAKNLTAEGAEEPIFLSSQSGIATSDSIPVTDDSQDDGASVRSSAEQVVINGIPATLLSVVTAAWRGPVPEVLPAASGNDDRATLQIPPAVDKIDGISPAVDGLVTMLRDRSAAVDGTSLIPGTATVVTEGETKGHGVGATVSPKDLKVAADGTPVISNDDGRAMSSQDGEGRSGIAGASYRGEGIAEKPVDITGVRVRATTAPTGDPGRAFVSEDGVGATVSLKDLKVAADGTPVISNDDGRAMSSQDGEGRSGIAGASYRGEGIAEKPADITGVRVRATTAPTVDPGRASVSEDGVGATVAPKDAAVLAEGAPVSPEGDEVAVGSRGMEQRAKIATALYREEGIAEKPVDLASARPRAATVSVGDLIDALEKRGGKAGEASAAVTDAEPVTEKSPNNPSGVNERNGLEERPVAGNRDVAVFAEERSGGDNTRRNVSHNRRQDTDRNHGDLANPVKMAADRKGEMPAQEHVNVPEASTVSASMEKQAFMAGGSEREVPKGPVHERASVSSPSAAASGLSETQPSGQVGNSLGNSLTEDKVSLQDIVRALPDVQIGQQASHSSPADNVGFAAQPAKEAVSAPDTGGRDVSQFTPTASGHSVNPGDPLQSTLLNRRTVSLAGGGHMEFTLKAGHLGKIDVEVLVHSGSVNAQIDAFSPSTRDLIVANMQTLLNDLNKSGLTIGNMTVNLRENGGGTGERMHDQGQNTGKEQRGERVSSERPLLRGLVSIYV